MLELHDDRQTKADLVRLAAGRTLVEGRGLEDVSLTESHPLTYLRHGGLVVRQVSPGQDGVQVRSLQTEC